MNTELSKKASEIIQSLSERDLGSTLLSLVVAIGALLFCITIIRSIEIPIRIFLDKRRKQISNSTDSEDSTPKGF